MSAVLCLILFVLGILLAFAGGIIGLFESFQESMTWGLLYLFVPFASLVFLVKFWKVRQWLRRSFFMGIGGAVLLTISAVMGSMIAPPMEYAELGNGEVDVEEGFAVSSGNGTSATCSIDNDPFRDAIRLATQAANSTQTASTQEEWREVASTWQASIVLLGDVPSSDPNYETAQTKIVTYSQNLSYAQKNSK